MIKISIFFFFFVFYININNANSDNTMELNCKGLECTLENNYFDQHTKIDNFKGNQPGFDARLISKLEIECARFHLNIIPRFKIAQLQRLEFMSVTKCPLTTINKDNFENIATIYDLKIAECQLFDISSDAFSTVKRLVSLNLSKNNLVDLAENLFAQLPYLQLLDVSDNQLQYLPEDLCSRNHELRVVSFKNNRLQIIDTFFKKTFWIQDMKRFEEISFNGNDCIDHSFPQTGISDLIALTKDNCMESFKNNMKLLNNLQKKLLTLEEKKVRDSERFRDEISKLNSNSEVLMFNLASFKSENENKTRVIAQLNKDIESLNGLLKSLESDLNIANDVLKGELWTGIKKVNDSIKTFEIKFQAHDISSLHKNLAASEADNKNKTNAISKLEKGYETLNKFKEKISNDTANISSKLQSETKKFNDAISNLSKANIQSNTNLGSVQNTMMLLTTKNDNMTKEISKLTEDMANLEKIAIANKNDIKNDDKNLKLNNKFNELYNEIISLRNSTQFNQNDSNRTERKLSKYQQNITEDIAILKTFTSKKFNESEVEIDKNSKRINEVLSDLDKLKAEIAQLKNDPTTPTMTDLKWPFIISTVIFSILFVDLITGLLLLVINIA